MSVAKRSMRWLQSAGVASAVLLAGCSYLFSLIDKPTVTFRRCDITDVSFTAIGAKFIFDVQNPNSFGVDLARLTYQINIDGHELAEGRAEQPFHVPANGTGEVVLPVTVRFADFAASVESVFQKDTLPYTIRTRLGFATSAGVLEVPIATSGTFPAPRLPDVSLASAGARDLGPTGATLVLDLRIRNPNAFPVPLGALSYHVSINGTEIANGGASPGRLESRSTQPLPLSIRVDFLRSGLSLVGALMAGQATVALDGQLDLIGFQLPIRLQQSLDLH